MELSQASSPPSGTTQGAFHGCLAPFIEYLQREGLTESRIRCLRASARHFLVWLGQEDIDIGVIDDAVLRRFRRHDCRCREWNASVARCSPARPGSSSPERSNSPLLSGQH